MSMDIIKAIEEAQYTAILCGQQADYSLEKSLADYDLIADLTELKIKAQREIDKLENSLIMTMLKYGV